MSDIDTLRASLSICHACSYARLTLRAPDAMPLDASVTSPFMMMRRRLPYAASADYLR